MRESLHTQIIIRVKYYHSLNHIHIETISPYLHQTNMQLTITTNTRKTYKKFTTTAVLSYLCGWKQNQ